MKNFITGEGTIRVAAYVEKNPSVLSEGESFILPDNEYRKLMVEDTDNGIEEKTLTRIIAPFFTKKGEEGNGLGLSSVYGIVKQLKGYIFSRKPASLKRKITNKFRQGKISLPEFNFGA